MPSTVSSVDQTKTPDEHIELFATHNDAALGQSQAVLERDRELSVLQTAKVHWRAVLICFAAFTSALVFSYDTVVNGASISMPAFFLYFGAIGPQGPYLPSLWTALWTAMSSLMQALGAIIIGWVIDRLGRKWPACASAALTLVGTAVQYVAVSRVVLMVGKMISGLGIGAVMAIATTYAGEVVPLKLRAPIQTCLVVFIIFAQGLALGVIRIYVPNPRESAFRQVFAIQWAVGALAAIAWAAVPESPVWLATTSKTDAALRSMNKIYGPNNHPVERLRLICHTIQAEEKQRNQTKASYLDCFRGSNLKRTGTVAFLYSAANISGAAFLAQNIYFLIIAGLEPIHAFDIGIGGFGLAILIILASGAYLQKVSRRNVVLSGLVINLLFMAIIGGLHWAPGKGALWAIAVMMNVLISIQASTMQGAGWPIAAEIPSMHLRAKTLAIGAFAQTISTWFFVFITPYMYNVDSGNLGAKTGFIYAGTTVLLIAGAWVLIPDTTGLTTEEIDAAYAEKLSPHKFQTKAFQPASDSVLGSQA